MSSHGDAWYWIPYRVADDVAKLKRDGWSPQLSDVRLDLLMLWMNRDRLAVDGESVQLNTVDAALMQASSALTAARIDSRSAQVALRSLIGVKRAEDWVGWPRCAGCRQPLDPVLYVGSSRHMRCEGGAGNV